MSGVYLDTSVVVPLFATDALTDRARARALRQPLPWLVGDLVEAEFAAAIAPKLRVGGIARAQAVASFAALDALLGVQIVSMSIAPEDLAQARARIRRLDLPLRAPDAIHLAATRRLGAAPATFNTTLAAAAAALSLPVAPA